MDVDFLSIFLGEAKFSHLPIGRVVVTEGAPLHESLNWSFGEEERRERHGNPARKSTGMEGLESNRRVLLVSDGSAGYAKEFFGGKIKSILFIPWARADWDSYEDVAKSIVQRNVDEDLEVVSIHRFADPVAAVKEAEAFYVGGGNTFRLLKNMYETGTIPAIREKVAQGTPYLGTRYNFS